MHKAFLKRELIRLYVPSQHMKHGADQCDNYVNMAFHFGIFLIGKYVMSGPLIFGIVWERERERSEWMRTSSNLLCHIHGKIYASSFWKNKREREKKKNLLANCSNFYALRLLVLVDGKMKDTFASHKASDLVYRFFFFFLSFLDLWIFVLVKDRSMCILFVSLIQIATFHASILWFVVGIITSLFFFLSFAKSIKEKLFSFFSPNFLLEIPNIKINK